MRYFFHILLFVVLSSVLLLSQVTMAAELTVIYGNPKWENDPRQGYFIELLTLALTKTTAPDDTFNITIYDIKTQQSRAFKMLNYGTLDVLWSMTSIEREKILLPVRIPLLKGLLGHRVLMIRKADSDKFATITTLAQLRKLMAGQGHDWPDTQILRANELKVTTTSTYGGLFKMLQMKRFDYFPRGVNEAWAELETHQNEGFMIEPKLSLYYLSPAYFFVNQDNQALATRIEKGLRLALKDGSFDRLFYTYLKGQGRGDNAFTLDKLKRRTVLSLANPFLPPLTPINEKALWFGK